MNLFCFLITFVLSNVLADELTKYKEAVFNTNAAIKHAYNINDFIDKDHRKANGLEHVIEELLKDRHFLCPFAKLNFMIAMPDKTEYIDFVWGFTRHSELDRCTFCQANMQKEIENILETNIPVSEGHPDFGSLDLTNLADERRSLVKTALENILKRKIGSMYCKLLMKLERKDILGFNLASLIEERRVTGRSPKNIIERRVFDGPVYSVSLFEMCRLIGIYMSTKFPTSYIQTMEIDLDDKNCIMNDGTTEIRFKEINGEWWQISPDNDTVRQLEAHLR